MADTLPKTSMDPSRRAALVSTCVVGCAGAAGVAIPLVSTFQPSERAKNQHRSIKPEYLVVVGICSHLGCSPSERFAPGAQPSLPDNWAGGFLCPCHGSTFDMAGRVFKNKPANANLDVPPHKYTSDTTLLIGADDTTG